MPRSVLNATQCPKCLVGEKHPNLQGMLLIKVRVVQQDGQWYSQCLVCAGLWDQELRFTPVHYDEKKGWFEC